VRIVDRRHHDELAIDEFERVVLVQNAGVEHSLHFVGREPTRLNVSRRGRSEFSHGSGVL
jgi:hypothetical protein